MKKSVVFIFIIIPLLFTCIHPKRTITESSRSTPLPEITEVGEDSPSTPDSGEKVTPLSLDNKEADPDYLLLKYNSEGRFQWKREFNYSNNESAYAIGVDKQDNIYITGYSITKNSYDAVVVKYDAMGNYLWHTLFTEGSFMNLASEIAVTAQGECVVAGYAAYNGKSVPLLFRLNVDGELQWYRAEVNIEGYCGGISADDSGNIYFAGYSSNTALLIKYDYNGKQLWEKKDDVQNYRAWHAAALDPAGNIVLTGVSQKSGQFQGSYQHEWDYVTGKFDTDGNQIWIQNYEKPGHQMAYGIAADSKGNIIITGDYFDLNAWYILKYNPAGSLLWSQTGEHDCLRQISRAIAVDSRDNIYISGYCQNSIDGLLSSPMIVKYNKQGEILSSKKIDLQAGGISINGIATDSKGNLYLAGGIQ